MIIYCSNTTAMLNCSLKLFSNHILKTPVYACGLAGGGGLELQ